MIDLEHHSSLIVGTNTQVIKQGNCTVTQLHNENGDGVMTSYQLFEGVYLMYNDFHMESCQSNFENKTNLFCIDHCREGRIEHQIKKGIYAYTGVQDLKIDTRRQHKGDIILPLKHYHGITIYIDVDQAKVSLKKQFPSIQIDLAYLQNKFCPEDEPFIISGISPIEHIFHELYTVPEKIKLPYMTLKVFELLLFLDALEISSQKDEHPYFYRTQVEKVKAIHQFLITNIEVHYTLESLSKQFKISLTTMKSCFKSIYGDSIFAYMKTYKMNQAAVLLKTRHDLSISDIAGIVGYDSPGKFSTAFKSVLGMTPSEYKNNFV